MRYTSLSRGGRERRFSRNAEGMEAAREVVNHEYAGAK